MVGIHWRLPRLGRLRSFRVENIAVDRCADVMALFECRWSLGGGLGGGHFLAECVLFTHFSRRHLLLMLVSVR